MTVDSSPSVHSSQVPRQRYQRRSSVTKYSLDVIDMFQATEVTDNRALNEQLNFSSQNVKAVCPDDSSKLESKTMPTKVTVNQALNEQLIFSSQNVKSMFADDSSKLESQKMPRRHSWENVLERLKITGQGKRVDDSRKAEKLTKIRSKLKLCDAIERAKGVSDRDRSEGSEKSEESSKLHRRRSLGGVMERLKLATEGEYDDRFSAKWRASKIGRCEVIKDVHSKV